MSENKFAPILNGLIPLIFQSRKEDPITFDRVKAHFVAVGYHPTFIESMFDHIVEHAKEGGIQVVGVNKKEVNND